MTPVFWQCSGSVTLLSDLSGTFRNPSYNHNMYCEWRIGRQGDTAILTFTSFLTEAVHDVVTIYSCLDSACSQQQLLRQVSGGPTVPFSSASATGMFRVIFQTDSSFALSGFQAFWILLVDAATLSYSLSTTIASSCISASFMVLASFKGWTWSTIML
jgi:hypothetical protein